MKKIIILIAAFWFSQEGAFCQRILNEATIRYEIEVLDAGKNPAVAQAFQEASQTVYFKGKKARIDFQSTIRKQSQVYDAATGTGFVLKESGAEKYLLPLDAGKWQRFNEKSKSMGVKEDKETREILGNTCRKVVISVADGTSITAWYAPEIKTLALGFQPSLSDLDGIALEYEVNSAGVTIRYKATQISSNLVPANLFIAPASGYRILEF
jgi:GLPGLI family protein